MQRLLKDRTVFLNRVSVLALGAALATYSLLLTGCATVPASTQPPERKDTAPALPELREAWEQGHVTYVNAPGGHRIPVRLFGETESGAPVIMLHGLQSHSVWFVQSGAMFASLGHPVYALDRRGSGLSTKTRGDCGDFREMTDDVRTVAEHAMKAHNVDRVHVVGHCFGAIPASAFACMEPDMLASLILPTPGIFTKTDLAMGQKLRVGFDQMTGQNRYISVPLDTTEFTELKPYQDFIASDRLALKSATTSFYWNVARARKYIRKNSARITCPVWVGISGEDPIVDNDKARSWFDGLLTEDKRLVEFPDARHILEFSPEKDAYFREMQAWLAAQHP